MEVSGWLLIRVIGFAAALALAIFYWQYWKGGVWGSLLNSIFQTSKTDPVTEETAIRLAEVMRENQLRTATTHRKPVEVEQESVASSIH